MHTSPSDLQNIKDFKFFNLSGFNWMFARSVFAADNNQQIVEGIAARFAQHAGVRLEKVQQAFEKFPYPAPENNLLLVYILNNNSKVFIYSTSKDSEIHQSLSLTNYVNF